MLFIRIAVVIINLMLITRLFRKASGNLKFTKLNMISTIYYHILGYNLIGASLIYLGIRQHYMVNKIQSESIVNYTYYALVYTMIMFPIVLILMGKLLSYIKPRQDINMYVQSGISYNSNMIGVQGLVLFLTGICTLATFYVFLKLGYIPIFAMFRGVDINRLRQLASREFGGNTYVKNLFMLTLTPFVSYLAYIYYKLIKSRTWKYMFIYLAFLSVNALTYDFSKSPVISYLLGIYLIDVIMGNVKNNKLFYMLVGFAASLILFFYVVMMSAGSHLYSIYTGPLGRIFFSQIATLFLHIQTFPLQHPFLNGASFNGWMSFLIPTAKSLRSGRVVMSVYNAAGIEEGTAGVMNTVFIGEAYANFGIIGIIIAPIIFGIVISLFAYYLPGMKKSPVTILLYVQMTLQFVTIIEGGFVDIIYSFSVIYIISLIILFKLIIGRQRSYRNAKIQNSMEMGLIIKKL